MIEPLQRRLFLAAGPFIEQAGQVVLEAEHYDAIVARGGKTWSATTSPAGFVGAGAMAATPNTGAQVDANIAASSPELQYKVSFSTPGVYRVWLRGHIASGTDNSVHVGLDGVAVSSADKMSAMSADAWKWFDATMDGPVATINVASAGIHTINVWMREDGFSFDRVLLTKSTTLVPSGTGPAESPRIVIDPLPPPPPPPGSASLDPDVDPPSNVRRLTAGGQYAAFSPDGKKVAYIDHSFGDAWEVDLATGKTRPLTTFYTHPGYLRVVYLANGDYLLTGARFYTADEATRYHNEELWVLPADLSHAPVTLNQKVQEGTAVSCIDGNHISWTETAGTYPTRYPNNGTAMWTGDIVYAAGVPTLTNRKQVYYTTDYADVQDFRANDRELIFTRYVLGRAAVYGVNIDTNNVTAYRDAAGEYDEAEGVSPDGSVCIVESSRDKGLDKQSNQYIDLWMLDLSGSGKAFARLTRWGDFSGYKSSNPVFSPDGRYVVFQTARSGQTAGNGDGIFLMDLQSPASIGASGSTIYSDSFSSMSGWTVSGTASDGSALSATSNGNQSVLAKSKDGQSASVSITRTIDTSGFANIALNLTAFQSAATFESTDKLKIEVDTGAGFERLLTDGQLFQGIDNSSGEGVTSVTGNTTPTSTGWLALQTSASNNKSVKIRVTGTISAADEKYFLDNLLVRGTATA
jgi:Gylcosyl hydrolase family 115 C-terminal domain/WD40-like Beta Propeller Repeat